jgi:ADP-ribose pyrophosphatase YjhB (NUDIX family)
VSHEAAKSAALALIVDEDARVMVVTNLSHGCFTLPGGKVEEGESARGALDHELREEIGVSILLREDVRLIATRMGAHRMVHLFYVGTIEDNFRPVEETQIRGWMPFPMFLHQLSQELRPFYEEVFPDGVQHIRPTRLFRLPRLPRVR